MAVPGPLRWLWSRFWSPVTPLRGQLDHANNRILRGWAMAPATPERRLVLDVFHRGVFLGQCFAGAHRPDLEAQGIGDGRYGFIFHLPDDVPHPVRAADIVVATAAPGRQVLPISRDLHPSGRARRGIDRALFRSLSPYLAMLDALGDAEAAVRGDAPGPATAPARRARLDPLFVEDPQAGSSAFLVHIARKYGRSVARADRSALLGWYLERYATERGPKRAPLSRDDMARLLEEGSRDGPLRRELSLPGSGTDNLCAIHRWASQDSARLFVEDCLVTPEQASRLRQVAATTHGEVFPLSEFMRRYCAESAALARSDPRSERGRREIYAVCLLIALRHPSLAAYLPAAWVAKLLADEAALDATLGRLSGAASLPRAAELRSALTKAGVGPGDRSRDRHLYRGNRVLGGGGVVDGPPACDVQLIGPLCGDTGLGESCRRIAGALARTNLSVNLVDFAVGGRNPKHHVSDQASAIRRARLNIVHLNLEEVPEAFAYLPDVFSGTPTVAMPYWELSGPSAVHRLGLKVVDELWVASRFLAGIYADVSIPVRWTGMSRSEEPVPDADRRIALRRTLGVAPSTFLFLTTSDALSWVQRKNPLAVILAFQDAFVRDEDVALVVKTHDADVVGSDRQKDYWRRVRALCAADPRLSFVDASFEPDAQRTLLAAADCFVTLHRAEGLGLDTLDALGMGTPVVATAYSGVTDFCTSETAWLVAADRVAVDPADYSFVEPGHVWAAPRHDAAVSALRGVYGDGDARRSRAEAARRLVEEVATPAAVAHRLDQWVRQALRAHP